MADNGKVGGQNPAYVGFGTFKNFIGELADTQIPPRIDPSVMVNKSGSTKATLRITLEFLGLIDGEEGGVTDRLHELVGSYGTGEWQKVLGGVIEDAYGPIVNGVPLKRGTAKQLEEAFREYSDLSGSTLAKSIRFYLAALNDAGIEHSSHFRPPKVSRTRKKPKPTSGAGSDDAGTKDTGNKPKGDAGGGVDSKDDKGRSVAEAVLKKIPEFDGTWGEDVQKKWFEALERVVGLIEK